MGNLVRKRKSLASNGGDWKRKIINSVGNAAIKGISNRINSALSGASKSAESAVLTSEKRVVTQYKSKKRSRKAAKSYKATSRLIHRLGVHGQPQRIINFVTCYGAANSTDASRYFGSMIGYMQDSAYDTDLFACASRLVDIANNTNLNKYTNAKFIVDNMHLRTVIRNTSVAPASPGDWTGTLDIDVYTVVCRKNVAGREMTSDLETMLAIWKNQTRRAIAMDPTTQVASNATVYATAQQDAGTTAINQAVGDTLFDNQMFCKHFKIIKMVKVQLPVNEIFEISHHVSKDKHIPFEQLTNTSGLEKHLACKAGVTQGHIFNINGRAYTDGLSATRFGQGKCAIESYCRYSIKPIESAQQSAGTLNYLQTRLAL